MKEKQTYYSWRNAIRVALTLYLLGSMSMLSATSKEYTSLEVADLITDMEAGTYDVYILNESGATYDFKDIDVGTSCTFKAKEGLEQKPIVLYSGADAGAYTPFFDLDATDLTLTVKGVDFRGGTAAGDMLGITRVDKANVSIIIDDCEISGFTTSNGFIRLGADGASLVFTNTYVHDCYGRCLRFDNGDKTFGDVILRNNTFASISNDPVLHWVSSASSTADSISIDQCTFISIPNNVFKFGEVKSGLNITNCVFDGIGKAIESLATNKIEMNYCYQGFGAAVMPEITVTDTLIAFPQYTDSVNGNYSLLNESELKGKDGVTTIGDARWTAGAGDLKLEVANSTQILTNIAGQVAEVMSSLPIGSVYIVMDGEPQSTLAEMDAAVLANKGAKVDVTRAYTMMSISTESLMAGNYYAYAVFDADSISSKGTAVIAVYNDLNIQNLVQTQPNATDKVVTVTCSKDGYAYIAMEGDYTSIEALNAAVDGGRGAKVVCVANQPIEIPITDVRAGTYYAYAVDARGNISDKGINAITITSSLYVSYFDQVATNTEGYYSFAYVNAGTTGAIAYLVNDAAVVDAIVTKDLLDAAVASGQADSMTVTEELTDVKASTLGLPPGSYHFYLVKSTEVSQMISATVTVRKPVTYYFAEEETEEMRSMFYNKEIMTGDEVVLTTSGGHYGLRTYFRLHGGVIIRAQDGLAEKPVLTYDPVAYQETPKSYIRLMEFYPPAGMMHIRGIKFDGGSSDQSSDNNALCAFEARYNETFNYPYSLVYDDCEFANFDGEHTSSSGSVTRDGFVMRQRANIYADTIMFNHCQIDNIYNSAILFTHGSNYNYFDYFLMNNSTIADAENMIDLTSPDMTSSNININQCTVDSVGMTAGVASRLLLPDYLINVAISNSVFSNSGSFVSTDSALVLSDQSTITNTAFYNVPNVIASMQQNILSEDPVYYNQENGHYAVMNNNFHTASTTSNYIGDQRWASNDDFMVETDMIAENDSVLILTFSQPFDSVSAKLSANYSLSGDFGITGNPISVDILDVNSVRLFLSDFSGGSDFQTIVATVSGVTNVNTNSLQGGHNTATYLFPILANMSEQTVGNELGQFVEATCGSVDGYVYLVADIALDFVNSPTSLNDLVSQGLASKAQVTEAGTMTQISVENLDAGVYYAYAVDNTGSKMSVSSQNYSTIVDLQVNLGLQFGITNGADQIVTAQSSYANATIYLVVDDTSNIKIETEQDLLDAVAANNASSAIVTAAFSDVEIDVEGVNADDTGTRYVAYVVSDKLVSAMSQGAVIISQSSSSSIKADVTDDFVSIYSANRKVKVQLNSVKANIKVYNLNGIMLHALTDCESDIEINMPSGIFIVEVQTCIGSSIAKVIIR